MDVYQKNQNPSMRDSLINENAGFRQDDRKFKHTSCKIQTELLVYFANGRKLLTFYRTTNI